MNKFHFIVHCINKHTQMNKANLILMFLLISLLNVSCQKELPLTTFTQEDITIIPIPVSTELRDGTFRFTKTQSFTQLKVLIYSFQKP